MTHLGNIHLDIGDFAKASKTFREAIPIGMEVQSLPVALDALTGLAYAESHTDKARALEILCIVSSNAATNPETQARPQLLRDEIQNQFISSQVETIQKQVSTISLQEFVMQIEER